MGDLEAGIGFASIKQIGYLAGLLKRCMCPDTWRLWLVGQLIGRELRKSTKELHYAEAGAIISLILADDAEAKEAIGEMLDVAMAHSVALAQKRQNGKERVWVYDQATLFA
ncbi:MAG: hypothetical protein ABIH46_02675 [Chloroflexota bacterium]